MATIKESITVAAPVDEVFAYIDEPNNNPEWLVGLIEIHDLTGTGVGRQFHWTFKMVGLPLHGQSTTTERIPGERLVTESKGGILSTWVGLFEPEGDRTKLTMEVEYTIPIPVLGKLAEKLILKRNARELVMSLENVKEKLEG